MPPPRVPGVALDGAAILNGDMAVVRNENAAACAKRHIGTVHALPDALIILDDAVVDGNIPAVLDVNAARPVCLRFSRWSGPSAERWCPQRP